MLTFAYFLQNVDFRKLTRNTRRNRKEFPNPDHRRD